MKQKVGFGNHAKIEGRFDRYIGKYVTIYIHGGGQFAGMLKNVNGEDVILNPFLSTDYSENKLTKVIFPQDSLIRSIDISAIEPITKASLEGFCVYQNSKAEKDSKKD